MLNDKEYAAIQYAFAINPPTPEAQKLMMIASWLTLDLADSVQTDEAELKRYYNDIHDMLPALIEQNEEHNKKVSAILQAKAELPKRRRKNAKI